MAVTSIEESQDIEFGECHERPLQRQHSSLVWFGGALLGTEEGGGVVSRGRVIGCCEAYMMSGDIGRNCACNSIQNVVDRLAVNIGEGKLRGKRKMMDVWRVVGVVEPEGVTLTVIHNQ